MSDSARRTLFCLIAVTACGASSGQFVQAQMFGTRTLGQPLTAQPRPGLDDVDVGGENVGSLTGSERFLRDNRSATDFVGVDQSEANTFVGAGQVIEGGRVRSAIETLQNPPDRAGQMNQIWQASAPRAPYPPRLQVNFEVPKVERFWSDQRPPLGHFELTPAGDLTQVISADASRNATDSQVEEPELNLPSANRRTDDATSQIVFEQANPDLTRRVRRSGADTLEVFVSGRTAVIRGVVNSQKQRQIAELLIGFEPGISKVQNEIVVANP